MKKMPVQKMKRQALLLLFCIVSPVSSFSPHPSLSKKKGRVRVDSSVLSPSSVPSAHHPSNPRYACLFMSSGSIDEQGMEALQSLVEFHEGQWKGKAKSFTVTPDVAAGIVQRKDSPEYTVTAKLGLDYARRDFTLRETMEWKDNVIFVRKLSLQDSNVDVDAVDASYSLDSTLPDFPAAICGTEKLKQFMIEHCIAVSNDERARCLAIYGADQNLIRVVVCEETRIQSERTSSSKNEESNSLSAADLIEMQSDIDRLVDKIAGQMPKKGESSDAESTEVSQGDRVDRLQQAMSSGTENGATALSKHTVSLLELSAGVWLGDTIIRDMPMVPTSPLERGQGFGPSTKQTSSLMGKGFAKWSVGVQKVAWRWMWNFGEEIRQINDVGKAMGAEMAEELSQSLSGSVCVNESLSRRIKQGDRMVYIDWSGDNVGFLLGSYSIQVGCHTSKYKVM